MPDEPQLQIHPRLSSADLRRRLDAYCERHRWSLTTAVNVLIEQGLTADEAHSPATPPAGEHP